MMQDENRRWLSNDLMVAGYTPEYVTAIGMATRTNRLAAASPTKTKAAGLVGARDAYVYMAVTILKIREDLSEDAAKRLAKDHMARWAEATDEDSVTN